MKLNVERLPVLRLSFDLLATILSLPLPWDEEEYGGNQPLTHTFGVKVGESRIPRHALALAKQCASALQRY